MIKKNFFAFGLFLLVLLFSTSAYAQDKAIPGPKVKSQTQTTSATKQGTTTGKSDNKNTTTKNNSSSSTSRNTQSSSSSTQQSQTSNSSSSSPTSKPTTGYINGHEWVDLGLSVKWATCNVGASSPSEYGNYYAWGETRTKSSYTSDNSVTYGKNMGSIAGDPNYDAARANWGGTWRLPTKAEIEELVSKCTRVWTTQGGHNGYKVTGPNGNSIFLPAAGWRYGTSLIHAGDGGYYWSATPNGDHTYGAYYLYFISGLFYGRWSDRYGGQSVRAVSE